MNRHVPLTISLYVKKYSDTLATQKETAVNSTLNKHKNHCIIQCHRLEEHISKTALPFTVLSRKLFVRTITLFFFMHPLREWSTFDMR